MKKLIFLFLTFFIAFSAKAYDFSAVAPTGQTLYYTITSSSSALTVQVTYPGNSSHWQSSYTAPIGSLVIPCSVSYDGDTYSVTAIDDNAFTDCSGLTSVTIPNSVTSIGGSAFYVCHGLTSVTIPNSVTSIGTQAFGFCTSLASVTIPSSVTSIGSKTFDHCSGLTSVTIPNSVTSIGRSAFEYCTSLTSVTIPNSVTSIGEYAFNWCSGLTSLTISNSVTSIGSYAFANCTSLDSLYLGSGILTIGRSVFQNSLPSFLYFNNNHSEIMSNGLSFLKNHISTLVIGDSVQQIEQNAFSGCGNLTSLTIGNSVTSIGNNAFQRCSRLTSLTIPNSVTNIGDYAFYGCTQLDSLYLGSGNTTMEQHTFYQCNSVSLLYFNNNHFELLNTALNTIKNSISTLVIGDSVQQIEQNAFQNCTGLTSLAIGNSVTSIGNAAFDGCSGLTNLIIPNSVTSIGNSAFSNCSGLTSLTIGNSVTSIGNAAFDGCSGLTSLTIPNSVTSIGGHAFSECRSLSSLTIPNSITSINAYAFQYCSGLTNLIIPNSVTSIGLFAFYGCISLSSLTIPNSVTSIGNAAFDGCSGLTSLTIGNSVTSIGGNAFSNCSGLTSLTIPNSVTSIGNNAFQRCSGLTSLTIGNSVTSIGNSAFKNCSGLVILTIPNSVSNIGRSAFSGCTSLDSLYIGTGLEYIDFEAFANVNVSFLYYNAKQMGGDGHFFVSDLIFGDSVQVIPTQMFQNNHRLKRLNIPNSVETIGAYAFYGCDSLEYIIIGSSQDLQIDSTSFENCNIDTLQYNANHNYLTKKYFNCRNLIVGDSVSTIVSNAFKGCSGITGLTLNNNLSEIFDSAFFGCSGISNNVVLPNTLSSIGDHAFDGCSNMTGTMIIPSSLTSMGTYAFRNCSHLTGLTLLDTLSYIPAFAFYGCSGLTSLLISDDVETIGTSAFENCTSLTGTLTIPSSMQSIGHNAFKNCDNLLFLDAEDAPMVLEDYAFADCDRLTGVDLGEGTTTIGNNAFQGCFRLNAVEMGNAVTTIGSSAFSRCVRLENPRLSASLTTIGDSAFQGCSTISGELEFPPMISSIGNDAYSGVGNITKLTMKGAVPPTIYSNTFGGIPTTTPVRVPCGSVLNYYVTNYWENFSDIAESAPYLVTVNTNNSVMGTAIVTQQPTCNDHTARMQATALSGYHFLQWNDGNTSNPRQILVNSDTTFESVFAVNYSYITVTCNDSTMGGVTGTGLYNYNAPVTMSANAHSGYHFLRWSDGIIQNPRYISATRDSVFRAIFVSNVSSVTVGSANPEMGTVSGGGVYYYQNQVSLSATPLYGYHFTMWNDGNTMNPRTITIIQDSSFTAFFALNTYAISANSNSSTMGSVSGSGSYTYNTEMSMIATPAYGYHFVQWNDGNTNNPRTITVTRDSNFTAQFVANTYYLTVDANDPAMGSAYGAGTYNYNSQVTLTAVATYGYHFTQWSDGVTDNPRIVTVSNSANYVAQFAINSYIINAGSSNPAIGTVAGGGSYNYLTPISLSAMPNIGYHFTQWSDGNMDNPRLVTVTQNATYTAQFAINSYAVSVTSDNATHGTVSGSGTFNHFATDTLRATPFYGYHFTQWNDGNTDNPRVVVVTDVASYTAQFDPNSYSVLANSTDMTIGVVTGGGSYPYQSQIALTAIANPHYHFVQWQDSMSINPRTITVTRDTVFTAQFQIDSHSVTVTTTEGDRGIVSGSGMTAYNSQVWISATANYGYHFTQWSDGNTQNPRHVLVLEDTHFVAQFAPNIYTATVSVNEETRGSVTPGGTYDYLTPLLFTATANYGYHFAQWDDGNSDNPRSLTLTQDTALEAQFEINSYYLQVSCNDTAMGTVSGDGSYLYQTQVTLSAVAAEHYHFVQWNDGSTTNPRTLMVTCDSVFVAQFEEDPSYDIRVISEDTTRGYATGSGTYYAGEQVVIEATPYEHYYFSQWSDGVTSNPRMVNVVETKTYTACFEPYSYSVTVTANDYSMGDVMGSGSYAYGTATQIQAHPFSGYQFDGWSDGDTAMERMVTVLGDTSFTALFSMIVGIDEAETSDYSFYSQGNEIVVEGAENRRVTLYDMTGRLLATKEKARIQERFPVGTTGVYLIRVDGQTARKIVIIQ